MLRLTLRVDRDGERWLGPGKIRLLELIAEHGSISRAGREMAMSYRRAWRLVEAMNDSLGQPVVAARPGGAGGGGATVTPAGAALIDCYRKAEADAIRSAGPALAALEAMLTH
ncbi:LysR family transcriptional regulator [Lichenicola cladoniae]|uniref:LysR family transcriptional regulator n=1 Tax=Lichenicola cladoniae TaxID=1484109 RepID=A0A6M8HR88_9PROT|nr:LysR family transcriptional regulator [Lichenicola cladoniae]NPD69170.1 LysR family transcriptional regulator [Acetobacteraceae bacterium]QKE90989.1 LysR family transcriptional regulator [Lichenicola cladoniae]